MSEYLYFPSTHDRPIRTLLLDANVTSHLDSIARRGSNYRDSTVRDRMSDLVDRLAEDVVVMPGLGAAESVIRRGPELRNVSNYRQRGANAMQLLVDDKPTLRAWLAGGHVQPTAHTAHGDDTGAGIPDAHFHLVREDMIMPSYAIILKAYQMFLQRRNPIDSFRDLELFAEELYARGSREIMLGALLLTGSPTGRQMALNIMKLHQEKDLGSTLEALWNTSFDLTHSRLATTPSLPELRDAIVQPAVFVTDDRHLGKLLAIVHPVDAIAHPRGGGFTADGVKLRGLVRNDLIDDVLKIIALSGEKAWHDDTDVQLLQRVRRYKAAKKVERLEAWFAGRRPS